MRRLQEMLLDWLGLGGDRRREIGRTLVRGSIGSFGLNVTVNVLNFLIAVLLARLLGTAGYGAYAYAMGWVALLGIPAGMGLSRLMVREVASYREEGDPGHLAGILRWATRTVGLASLGTLLLGYAALWLLGSGLEPRMRSALQVGLLLVPILAYVRTNQATLQGLHRVVRGQIPESLVLPVVFIAGVLVARAAAPGTLSASVALGLNLLAALVALLLSVLLLRRAVPVRVREVAAEFEGSAWLQSALSLVLLGGLHVLNNRTDVIMLGAIAGAEPVGVYNVAVRGAELITFVAVPVHAALGPAVSTLHAGDDAAALQRVVTRSTQAVFWLSLPLALGLVLFGEWFLLLFGAGFTAGSWALSVLGVSQMVYLALGPVALLLIMTGHERDAAVAVGVGAVLNVVLNGLLIPLFDLEGAAVATATSKLVWGGVMLYFVVRRLDLRPTLVFAAKRGLAGIGR